MVMCIPVVFVMSQFSSELVFVPVHIPFVPLEDVNTEPECAQPR